MQLKFDGELMRKSIRTRRVVELDLDIRTAAKQIGFSPATLSRIENGKKPDIDNLKLISTWLQVPMDYFYTPIKKKSKTGKK